MFQSQQFIHYLFIAVSIVIIAALGVLVYALTRRSLRIISKKKYISESLRIILQGLSRWLIIIAVILIGLQQAGIRVASIWAALLTIVAMLAVGFIAVWSILSNILCSILMIIFRPFSIGDDIEIIEATGGKGLRGEVVNFNVLFTFLKEKNDTENAEAVVQIPNNVIFQKTVRRREGKDTRSLDEYLFKIPRTDAHGSKQKE
ncbi:MAG: mechanosensitive ion channel domain-containing protein [bacterium]